MARTLIVGCGCRGAGLAAALAAGGHAVRGTTRRPERLAAIGSAGAEAVLADPNRLATISPHLEAIGVLCWLMGTVTGAPDAAAAIHGPRLESLLGAIVDAPVRGVVYEAAGTVDPVCLERGSRLVRDAGASHRIPTALIERDPRDHSAWLEAAVAAVDRLLAAPG